MARVRSVEFLPPIFQTDANKQFLAATLDTLVQEPKFKKTQGYIGRTVGPGVNPNDRYVIEPSKVRNDYQLEPGVISLDPAETTKIQDAITYPGINDALEFQGADVTNPQRLYTSEYYTWDPFVDFDAFINFNQYFWVPEGPDTVTVSADAVPTNQDFIVTRANGVYTFSGVTGNNPTIDLVRGGTYTFQISNNDKETVNFRVGIQDSIGGPSAYLIDYQANPTLTLARGNTYVFTLTNTAAFPFWLKTQPTTGIGDAYNNGVSNNGGTIGVVTFTVPQNAPNTLYYSAQNNTNLHGQINIIDNPSTTGPGFWIQTSPGVSGKNPVYPNLGTRSVLGVGNNGEDLGTVSFSVPAKTAQQYYYNLTDIGGVDLLTTMPFADINGANLYTFIQTYGGIDGITTLEGKTLVFDRTDVNRSIWRIDYVGAGPSTTLSLVELQPVLFENKFTIQFGAVYSNTQWYVDGSTYFVEVPLLSAVQDVLYYQDGTDPEIFGQIRLIEPANASDLLIEDIIGKQNYTSPNGVVFTNGLKVKFTGSVVPATYASGSVSISCIETTATINLITCVNTAGLLVGQTIEFFDTIGGLVPGVTYYVRSILSNTQFTVSQVSDGAAVILTNETANVTAVATALNEYYVEGVGTAIELLPVSNFVVPEPYATDANPNTIYIEPNDQDYLTISRASKDLNAWTRSNRWFHIDVLNATAEYNKTEVTVTNTQRGKRPILQFRAGLRLFNMGTEGKPAVNAIDFTETDALSNVEGATSYTTASGYTLVDGSRIVFGADLDPDVRDKIYVVNFVTPDSLPPLIAQPIINLIVAQDGNVLPDQCTVCLSGTQAGTSFYYDGVAWIESQQKTAIQQAPLFDVYDANGYSFGDRTVYPSSTFLGSKLFSYAPGFGNIDPVLRFKLQYLTLNNIGDIVFDNNLYTDTFNYVSSNIGQTLEISTGCPREYTTRTEYARLLGWQTAVTPTLIRQQFKFTYDTQPLLLDVAALTDQQTVVPAVKVYVGSVFQSPDTYSVVTTANTTTITFLVEHLIGEVVEVEVLSNQTSQTAFYQVPSNLAQNPLNQNSPSFSLGVARQHYETICENLTDLQGPINGANNTRDLGNIIPYGQLILQQSSPLTLAGYFMRSAKYNIFAAMEYSSREYQKYKNKLLEAVTQQTIDYTQTYSQVLDLVIGDVIAGKTETSPFYWSDMLPGTQVFTTTNYTVSVTTTNQFNTVQVYNYKSANYLGMNVYLNNRLLTRGLDYFVSTTAAVITLSTELFSSLSLGDVVSLQEYQETYGTFVPNTPTKLGLYPAWRPAIITVKTTSGTALVIQGHDGSQTPVFNDIRDQILLEFETRIFNNLKLDDNPIPLTLTDVLPGQFRTTDYSYSDISNILNESFLTYVGWNKLDYISQNYIDSNPFTFNYSESQNKLNNELLLGAWRGIYRYFYDTQQPEEAPWEMLGFTERPLWWELTYGPAPYTRDNQVLWDDLELGLVRDPLGPYISLKYARPGLTQVLPTDSEGVLLAPLYSVVGTYPENSFQRSWAAGDGGPVEASWWNSSDYPFAVMRLLSLTRPAEFFSLFADRDLYRYNDEFGQFLYNNRYRLSAKGVEVYGNGVSKASYIDWIVDYNRLLGQDSTQALQDDLANLDVRLCYRMASFTDKQYMKIYTEKSSPASTNNSLLIPDESYDLLLYKNQPFGRSSYSSVVIQVVDDGWAVYGYSTTRPFFTTLVSQPAGLLKTFVVGDTTVQVPANYTENTEQIPYGYVFTSMSGVANFLLSYGKYLQQQGFEFDAVDNAYILNWDQMVQEFMYWANQGWGVNTLLNLNPLAFKLSVFKEQAVVDSIAAQTSENLVLNQNRQELPMRNLNIVRIDNNFTIQPLNNESVSYVDLRYTSFENMVVLKNASLFGDLIYYPITGARQSRLYISAATSTEWNGSVDAQGFILNQNNVEEWTGLKTYPKGTVVKYKGSYWSAATIVQPSVKFNYNDWNQSDYTYIQQGLLPNLANKADQLANSYNINSANLESDNDLLSYGLIGFRPRQYLAALNLDDVSQLNVYRQFLGTKGTILSADLLGSAQLNKERAQYTIFENWAIQRSTYGANANRSFIDLRLNRALLNSDPAVVQVVIPQQQSQADQAILLDDVWKSSFVLTSPDVLPTTTVAVTDIELPTAGYVNLNDADITVFNIDNPSSLNANINSIQNGTSIWVAKTNAYDWNIYRAEFIPGQIQHVCDNLNGTSRIIFSKQHGLAIGDTLIIRFFDAEVNGVYKVLSVTDLNTVNIAFGFESGRTVADGSGIGFKLQTMRVSQASDVINLPYVNQILPGARVWVDNDGQGRWEVLEKQNPFTIRTKLEPAAVETSDLYGSSLAQAQDQMALFVGSPNLELGGDAVGGVYVYLKGVNNQYTPISPYGAGDARLILPSAGTRNFGKSLDFGNQIWGVSGAPGSLGIADVPDNGYTGIIWKDPTAGSNTRPNPFVIKQLLTIPEVTELVTSGAEFGFSSAVSKNERWVYVGAPGINKVYAYSRVDWEDQYLTITADNTLYSIYFGQDIKINDPGQVNVFLNNRKLVFAYDYTINPQLTTVEFLSSVPVAGDSVKIQRVSAVEFTGNGSATTFPIANSFYTVSTSESINAFTVSVNNMFQRPNIDYIYQNGNIVFYTAPPAAASIIVKAQAYFQYQSTLTVPGLAADERFGHSVACGTDGQQVIVGCADATVNGLRQAGSVYVFSRNVQKFISPSYSATGSFVTILNFGILDSVTDVTVNNQFLLNVDAASPSDTNTYSVYGDMVIINCALNAGDVLEVGVNHFALQQTVTENVPAEFTNFGQAVDLCPYNCSLYVGAPQSSLFAFKGGAVQRSVAQDRVYGTITSTVAYPTLTPNTTLRVNNVDCNVTDPDTFETSLEALVAAINTNAPNATASLKNGLITISVINSNITNMGNKLQVSPGSIGNVYHQLGFKSFIFTQTISSPLPKDYAQFGAAVAINDTAENLVVGAPRGTLYLPNTFDYNAVTQEPGTTFDGNSTTFYSPIVQSGAVYTFDYLPSASDSPSNPGKFVFGQQISNTRIKPYDNYGSAVAYNSGVLVAGAPYNDFSEATKDSGAVWVFQNTTLTPAWTVKHLQQPVVDIYSLNSVFMYDRITSAQTEFFDFFDPLQGKILGAAQQNLDYIGAIDPAQYNIGAVNNNGLTWAATHVGEMWWDTSTVRFIDPNQNDIVYASRRWGQTFPGSQISVYQWVESDLAPASYVGPGVPRSIDSYVINTELNRNGLFVTKYYFWVRNVPITYTQQGKTLSAAIVAQYIDNPRSSGISYIAPINASTIAIYNGLEYVNAADTIISIEFDKQFTTANVHQEYELIAQDKPSAFLSDSLYRKLQDSFCGTDSFGNLVPDPNLPASQRYGIQIRPRQTMFVDRYAALKNYITRVNSVLVLYPISETRSFTLLNSQEPVPGPTSGVYDAAVPNLEILSFQDIDAVPLGYTYLVESDSNNRGLWTIYTVQQPYPLLPRQLILTRVQNYKTSNYWSYINWYLPGYNPSTKIYYEVPNYSSLAGLNVPVGTSVKVTANSQGKFEIYLLTDAGWERVGLQDGTIELSATLYDYQLGRFGFDVEVFDTQYYDEYPSTETRKIIQAINEQLLIDELLIERNRALTLMFDYILSEQEAPEWLTKTSLIDVNHKIRQLLPFPNYIRDNQDFVLQYLQEVKPYHVQVREFNLSYDGLDEFQGDVTDFDVPAYFNTGLTVPQYTSPILTNDLAYTHSNTQSQYVTSDAPETDVIWSTWPWNQWFEHFLMSVESFTIIDGGSGYTEAPTVVISGDAIEQATGTAVINSQGQVVDIVVTSPGSGYQTTPVVDLVSDSGTGARAYANLGNGLVRSFKTVIKYDRNQYQTSILTWNNTTQYVTGDLVRYYGQVWTPKTEAGPGDFIVGDWTQVAAGDLSGIDRTMGYYVPNANEPGLQLSLLIDGVDYPGVQVYGRNFDYVDPLDTIYASSFADQYLGTRPTDINVVGGEFIGPYEGHAPEELVNGSEYDTLDLRVYTRPGSDWERDGHGFQFKSIRYTVEPDIAVREYSWASVVEFPAQVLVSDVTNRLDLTLDIDYTVDWVNKAIVIINNDLIGTVINITVYEVGGGSQLYRAYYTGAQASTSVVIPVASSEINTVGVFVNGEAVEGSSWTPYAPSTVWSPAIAYQYKEVVTSAGLYYRAIQNVPVGVLINDEAYWLPFVPSTLSTLYWNTPLNPDDGVALVVLGDPAIFEAAQPYDTTGYSYGDNNNWPGSYDFSLQVHENPFSWSTAQTQTIIADATVVSTQSLIAINSLEGTNPANLILTRNGRRLFPPAGICWIGAEGSGYSVGGYDENGFDDGSIFGLPQRMGYSFSQGTINAATDVKVWVDSILQTQGVDYFVTPYTGTNDRNVVFPNAVPETALVTISVSTIADYDVDIANNTIVLNFAPNLDDVFVITTWNDTQQQDLCTLVFVGPVNNGTEVIINQPYDSTGYSATPGSPVEWKLYDTYSDVVNTDGVSSTFVADNIDYALVSPDPTNLLVYYDDALQTGNYSLSDAAPGTAITFSIPPEPYDSVGYDENNSLDASIFPGGSFDYDYVPPPLGNVVTAVLTIPATYSEGQIVFVLPVDPMDPPSFYQAIQNVPEYIDINDTAYWMPIVYVDIPGSYDYTEGQFIPINDFYLDRPGITGNRLWVTLDGYRLFEGVDYTVQNDYLILASGTIGPAQKLVVTEFTESIVPDAMAFRIFQDMRGIQATYRITESTTTMLVAPVLANEDTIYVQNAQRLTQPDPEAGVFGVITIDGERIMYRERNLANNTISSLLRGTAGTAAADHDEGSLVYDMGRSNLMPFDQDYVESNTTVADGLSYSFTAPNIARASLYDNDGFIDPRFIEVFVGGIRQLDNYVVDPSALEPQQNNFDILPYSDTPYGATDFVGTMITLDYAPPAGVEVTILVRRGTWWYDVSTPATRALPLQQTNTPAARFLRGL